MDASESARLFAGFAFAALPLAALGATAAIHPRLARLRPIAGALAALAALALAIAGAFALAGVSIAPFAWRNGFPGDPLRLELDVVSAPFALLVGISAAATLVAQARSARPAGEALTLALHIAFATALAAALCAGHVLLLLGAWELMTLASAALVAADPGRAQARRATFVYLALSQLGAGALAVALLRLSALAGTLQLQPVLALLHTMPSSASAPIVWLVTIAAAVKLGLVPLHSWLPLAHPEAPAPASALMSGAMVKVGLYLLLRVVWIPLGTPPPGWGEALLVAGVLSALTGAMSAALDPDAKRVLAWSTIKHTGVLASGLGLAATLATRGQAALAGVALAATLYHAIGHSLAKTLGFLAVGEATHALGTRDLERMGGLWRALPRTTLAVFVATAALSGAPLLSLFASEWLLFQVVILGHSAGTGTSALHLLAPFAGAGLALAGALALAAMAKLVGIGFLGRPRDPAHLPHEPNPAAERAMLALSALVIAWGVLAPLAMGALGGVVSAVLPEFDARTIVQTGALSLAAGRPDFASVSPLALAVLLGTFGVLAWTWTRAGARGLRRAPSWSCGAPLTPLQQYSARGLTQPLRRVFADVIHETDEAHVGPEPALARGRRALETSLAQLVVWSSDRVRLLQSGRLELYLGMLLATLVALLVWRR